MIHVVKIGGNVIDDPAALDRFIDDFARFPGKKILIHGGGKLATRLSRSLGIETKMIDGRRITDAATLEVVTMVYAGLINKTIVSALQAKGCDAMGLSGADGNLIRATRRDPNPIDYGFVGDIDLLTGVNSRLIGSLLDSGVTPVVCALTHDGHGQMLNSNADSVASAMAVGASRIESTKLIYCFEMPGVMRDVNDPQSVIPSINRAEFDMMRADGIVAGGMIPKIEGALRAVDAGVDSVIIRSATDLNIPSGTVIHG